MSEKNETAKAKFVDPSSMDLSLLLEQLKADNKKFTKDDKARQTRFNSYQSQTILKLGYIAECERKREQYMKDVGEYLGQLKEMGFEYVPPLKPRAVINGSKQGPVTTGSKAGQFKPIVPPADEQGDANEEGEGAPAE